MGHALPNPTSWQASWAPGDGWHPSETAGGPYLRDFPLCNLRGGCRLGGEPPGCLQRTREARSRGSDGDWPRQALQPAAQRGKERHCAAESWMLASKRALGM